MGKSLLILSIKLDTQIYYLYAYRPNVHIKYEQYGNGCISSFRHPHLSASGHPLPSERNTPTFWKVLLPSVRLFVVCIKALLDLHLSETIAYSYAESAGIHTVLPINTLIGVGCCV